MTDELLLNNYLIVLKGTIEVYVHGTIESSNPDVRDLLHGGLDNTLISQADTYDLMTEYGYYQVNNVKTSEINKTYNKIISKN